MATFRKRGKTWRVEICKNGIRHSATFDTKSQAKEWASITETQIIERKTNPFSCSKTLGDAFDRYANEVSPKKKGERWEKIRLNALKRYPLSETQLSDLASTHIALWRDQRLTEVSPSSVNRELNLISSVLNTARLEWRWISQNPVSDIKRPKNPKSRDRRISAQEIQRMLDLLGYDDEIPITSKKQLVGAYFLLAIETAMRLGELSGLNAEDIHLAERFVELSDTKNNDSRKVPLTRRAVDLFQKVIDSRLTVNSGVASALFKRACRQGCIENLRFHDTRHEALTRLARKLGVLDLARMVGHRDPRSLMIYYNATATEIAERLD
jgi:integrase